MHALRPSTAWTSSFACAFSDASPKNSVDSGRGGCQFRGDVEESQLDGRYYLEARGFSVCFFQKKVVADVRPKSQQFAGASQDVSIEQVCIGWKESTESTESHCSQLCGHVPALDVQGSC